MECDFFKIDIPDFIPIYEENKPYGWTKYKEDTWDLLVRASGNYCMYCYDKVVINNQKRGQIEHGMEKTILKEKLTDCVPNLGVACENCNQKYKRKGEKLRKLNAEEIADLIEVECPQYECKKMCDAFKRVRMRYVKKGKIILQPFGVVNEETGHTLHMQYDLLEFKYVPSTERYSYTEEELKIIEGHIELFGLNSALRKNHEIARYCKGVVAQNSLLEEIEFNNMLVDLLREKLKRMKIDDAIHVCRIIYEIAWIKLNS